MSSINDKLIEEEEEEEPAADAPESAAAAHTDAPVAASSRSSRTSKLRNSVTARSSAHSRVSRDDPDAAGGGEDAHAQGGGEYDDGGDALVEQDEESGTEDSGDEDSGDKPDLEVDAKTMQLANEPLPDDLETEADKNLMTDLQTSLAFFTRQATAGSGKEDANFLKIHEDYEKLHKVFIVSRSNEKKLVKRVKDLTLELQANSNKVQAALKMSQNDRSTISSLKKEVTKAWKIVESGNEKETRAKEAINSMKSEIESLRRSGEAGGGAAAAAAAADTAVSARQKHYDMEMGHDEVVQGLIAAKEEAQSKHEKAEAEISLLREQVSGLEEKLYTASTDRGSLDHEILSLKDLLATKKSEMDRDYRNQEKLKSLLLEAQESVSKKESEFNLKINEIKQFKEQCSKLESIVREERQKVEKSENENEAIATRLGQIQQDYDEQVYTINGLMGENQRQSRELKKWEEEVVKHREELRNVTRARDTLTKRLKSLEEVKAETEFDNDTLRGVNHSVMHDLDAVKKELDQTHKQIESVKRDRDIAQKNFVRATGNTQKQLGAVKLAEQTKRNLEQEIAGYKDEAAKMRKLIFSLEKDRDRHIAAATKAEKFVIGRDEEVKIKEMHLFDASKKIADLEKKLKEQQYMYENVRTERNLYSKNCIEFEDETIEMKRKLKIMSHQIEQLKEEISNKEQALVKESFEHSRLEKEKESLGIQIAKLQHHTEEAQEMIKNQQSEESKLRHIITETDAERLRQKKEYEAVVQERDILGTQLIRRNDELSLLYEKIKIQTSTLNKGEIQYRERLEDIRVLRLEIKRLRREKAILQTETQNVEGLRTEIFKLQREILRERTRVKVLEEELESPMNIHRWRKLSGSDPSTFELITKIQTLQKRLISKTEEVVEKELIITQKEKLYAEVKEVLQRQPGPEIAEELRAVKSAVKVKMKECKSLASELNMYHSQVNEYKYEIERLSKELQDLKKKYYEQKKRDREDRKRAADESYAIKSHPSQSGPKFVGGGFNLQTGPHQSTHFHVPSLPQLPNDFAFADVVSAKAN